MDKTTGKTTGQKYDLNPPSAPDDDEDDADITANFIGNFFELQGNIGEITNEITQINSYLEKSIDIEKMKRRHALVIDAIDKINKFRLIYENYYDTIRDKMRDTIRDKMRDKMRDTAGVKRFNDMKDSLDKKLVLLNLMLNESNAELKEQGIEGGKRKKNKTTKKKKRRRSTKRKR